MAKCEARCWLTVFYSTFLILLITAIGSIVIVSCAWDLRGEILNKNYKRKLASLPVESANILICGDSRAERQVNSDLMTKLTDLKTLNIASGGLHIVTVVNGLEKKQLPRPQQILLISMSSSQVNDAHSNEILGNPAILTEMTPSQQWQLYHGQINFLLQLKAKIYYDYFRNRNLPKEEFIRNFPESGFLGIDGFIERQDVSMEKIANHTWYTDIIFPGVMAEIVYRSIARLARNSNVIVFYNPPVCQSFYTNIKESKIDYFEREFSTAIAEEVGKYPNVYFIDYYGHPGLMSDNMYYDMQHLNRQGAECFTRLLCRDLQDIGILGK